MTIVKRSKAQAKKDLELIEKIADRAKIEGLITRGYERATLVMDLDACMLNGADRLDLQKLLDSKEFDFTHDICGIARHMDRTSWPGQLQDCFVPRCYQSAKAGS